MMKASISAKLEQLVRRLEELDVILSSESATRDMDNFRKLSKEHADLEPVALLFRQYRQTEDDVATAQEMAADPSMKAYADGEIRTARERLGELEI